MTLLISETEGAMKLKNFSKAAFESDEVLINEDTFLATAHFEEKGGKVFHTYTKAFVFKGKLKHC